MKKKILLIIATVLFSVLFTLSACGGVEFNINFIVDGEVYATVSTGGNETIKMPENPVKENYTFDGWFWDKDVYEKPFTANSLLDAPLSSDMSVYAKFTEKHQHNYTETVIAPTCTEKGYTLHTCSRCGDSYKTDYINKLEHEFTDYVSDNNATYDSDGTKTARCNHGCGATDTITDVGTKLKSEITFKTLSVDNENNVFGKVANTQETFSFINEVNVSGNAEFFVSNDIYGINQIPTKTVPLEIGNNTFYVTEMVGNDIKLFTVTIRRTPMYTVTFNVNGGTSVENQTVEEDSFAIEPSAPIKAGYTFDGWEYDFSTPITGNITINAKWLYYTVTANKNIAEAGSVNYSTATKVTVGQDVTITATTNCGYTFVGWYKGEEELTSELTYTFTMPSENATYTAKWEIAVEMSNFNFTSTTTSCNITGLKDKTVTEIIVPDYVTSINEGAFSGCSQLESISLPFVGGSIKTASGTYQYPFGYIFGTSSYTGGTATTQTYSYSSTGSTTSTAYYIPTKLKSVTVTGGNILNGAFRNCSSLKSIIIPDSVTSIGGSAFSGCSKLTSITIPDSVTSIGYGAFYACSSLTSVYYSGTSEDWGNITIGSENNYLKNAKRYYYSETEPELNKQSTAYNGNYWHYVDGEIVVWTKEN